MTVRSPFRMLSVLCWSAVAVCVLGAITTRTRAEALIVGMIFWAIGWLCRRF